MMKILKVLQFDSKSSIKQYFLNTLSVKRNIYRAVDFSPYFSRGQNKSAHWLANDERLFVGKNIHDPGYYC